MSRFGGWLAGWGGWEVRCLGVWMGGWSSRRVGGVSGDVYWLIFQTEDSRASFLFEVSFIQPGKDR